MQATAQPANGAKGGLKGTSAGVTGGFKGGTRSVMGWDLTESCAEACSCELMRINTLGIPFEARTGPPMARFSSLP